MSLTKKKKPSLLLQTILLLIILILPLNVVSIYVMNMLVRNSGRSLISSVTISLDRFTAELDERMVLTDYYLYTTSSGEEYRHFMEKADKDHHTLYRNILNSSLQSISLVNAADGMFFYNHNYQDFLYVDLNNTDQLSQRSIASFMEQVDCPDSKWYMFGDDDPVLVRIISRGDSYYGAVVDCTKGLGKSEYRDSHYIFTDTDVMEEDDTGLQSYLFGTSGREIHCSSAARKAACYLHFYMPLKELTGNLDSRIYLAAVLLLVFVLVIPLLILLFRHSVSGPLTVINDAHTRLENGEETYRIIEEAGSQEFEKAYEGFNGMAQTLQELRLEKINKELAYKQMQLNNLQLQIRPHFLLNMMNLLYTLIHSQETREAQEMVLYLSSYFRYMFRSGRELELFDKELSLIREYLHISGFHYPDGFKVQWQIDPILSHLRIPPLLLHNFVENIIHHALIPDKTIHIVLFGEYDDGTVTLIVSDDGRGMTQEDADMINAGNFDSIPAGKHIGIRNSIARLKYYYGEETSVTVESAPDMGTTFTLTFPYELEEEE